MAASYDYISKMEDRLLPFAKTLYAYALANYGQWGVPRPANHAGDRHHRL